MLIPSPELDERGTKLLELRLLPELREFFKRSRRSAITSRAAAQPSQEATVRLFRRGTILEDDNIARTSLCFKLSSCARYVRGLSTSLLVPSF